MTEDPGAFATKQRKGTLKLSLGLIYKALASFIRIQGLQHKPKESEKKRDKLRGEYKLVGEYFKEVFPEEAVLGVHTLELLYKRLALSKEDEKYLSKQYLLIVSKLGQWVAGDEKLFRWSGESGYVRFCPNKPDALGIWNYELCGMLDNGEPFLLYTRSHTCDTQLGESIPCAEVMQQWGEIVKTKGHMELEGRTILVADAYYLDNVGREILLGQGVSFLCGVQACRFDAFVEQSKKEVRHTGDIALLYKSETKEMFVHRWYADKRIGQKFVFTNAYTKQRGNTVRSYVPGCDDFSLMFNVCDHFNRDLHDKTWPFRCPSDLIQLHNFLFSCLLLNVLNVYTSCEEIDPSTVSYQDQMLELADELYTYACTLLKNN